MNQQDIINQIRKTLPTQIAESIAGVQPLGVAAGAFNVGRPVPDTWHTYLRRLGNGLNGIVGAGGTTTVTEADIVSNAEKHMQKRYPGPYRVEQYYNSEKMKWDLRLKFADPQEETMWLLKQT